MQCEILTNNTQINIAYFSFEELEDNIPESEVPAVIKKGLEDSEEKENWKSHFNLIDSLRTLNKFHGPALNESLSRFTSFLITSIQNLRSNICKNALLLLQEVFGRNASVKSIEDGFLCKLLPLIYEKAVNDKLFIRNEAKRVIEEMENTLYGKEVVLKLISEMVFEKNFHLGEEAAGSLSKLVAKNCEAEEAACCFSLKALFADNQNKNESLSVILKNLSKMVAGKRAVFRNKGDEIISTLGKYIIRENIEASCENYLNKNEMANIIAKLESKMKSKAGTSKSEDFKTFMKNMKKTASGEEKENLIMDEGC